MKKIALSFMLWIGMALTLPPAEAVPACVDCNVILLSLDTLAAAHLGIYGGSPDVSPNIDRFAKSARIYRNAYAPSPWTLPSHAAMLTGYYPWRMGVHDEHDPVPVDVPLLSELLKRAGYRTAALNSGLYVDREHGFARGFDSFVTSKEWKDAPWIVDEAVRWLKSNHTKKFFLFIHSYHPHEPLTPSDASLAKLDPDYKGSLKSMTEGDLIRLTLGKTSYSPEDLRRISKLYDAGILDLDRELGRFFEELNKLGLDKNTVIVLTSDHGQGFGEHGLWGLHTYDVYEELIRVPFVVKLPQASAKELDSPISLTDLVPSVLATLRLPYRSDFDGKPLPDEDSAITAERSIHAQTAINREFSLPYRLEVKPSDRKKSMAERLSIRKSNWGRIPRTEKSVRAGKYKLILKFDGTFELYDLEKDPSEKTNLSSQEPNVAHQLKTLMLQDR
jgi:arylsulfatase A-like enzyme